jgi:hypothetical protein
MWCTQASVELVVRQSPASTDGAQKQSSIYVESHYQAITGEDIKDFIIAAVQ